MWLCHVSTKRQKKKRNRERLRLFPFPTTYLWTDRFLSQECSLSLFPDWTRHNQWEHVFMELPTLRPATLLSPIRLVKSRVWQRRRGPICCPCYITLSGWRSWGEMPFTKNSSLKTSTRSRNMAAFKPGDPLASGGPPVCDLYGALFPLGFWFHVQGSPASRKDGPSPWVVQCL